ncbi:MAG TPA: hypothetical protein VFV98_19335 [Vicinamibacterales bacterium]|nr:hypothetical protein [Vicinamibacterales bacterium]
MTRALLLSLFVLAVPGPVTEPAPRRPATVPIRMATPPAHVSAAFELPGGRVVVSDVKTPAVLVIDPVSGAVTKLGSVGAGPGQYVKPGGLYGGTDGGALLLDRAQLQVTEISPAGVFGRTYSIAVKGVTGGSEADIDLQRLDNRGFSYFVERTFGTAGTSRPAWPLIRFDPIKQGKEKIADLIQGETTTIVDGNMSRSQGVIGSPADGFGVAPDGRVAIVRGEPYRVEWIGVDGRTTRGPNIAYDPVPMTDADRAEFKTPTGGASVSAVGGGGTGGSGSGGSSSGMERKFAATKAPFSPGDIVVSPSAQVWVMRSRAASATDVIYDVFDGRGQRVDRLAFPDGSRVVGFGAGSVFVRETGANGGVTLKKYKVR